MLALLRDRNFVLWWLGGRISIMGDYVLTTALPFYVYGVSRSTLATGLIFMAQMLPPIVLGSAAGVYVDRWDRRRTMILTELVLGTVLLPMLAVRSGLSIWIVPIVALVEAAAFQFVPPCSSALIPAIVGRERLAAANSLLSTGSNLSVLVGPPLGALVLHSFGLSGVILVDVASYLFAAAMVYLISIGPGVATMPGAPEAKRDTAFWQEWMAGLRMVGYQRWIVGVFAVEATAMLGAGMVWVLLIVFIERTLHQGALQYGWWLSINAVGGIAGSFFVGYATQRVPLARLVAAGSILAGLTWLAIVRLESPSVMLALAPVAAIGWTIWSVSEQTMLQTGVTDQYLGRVFGAHGALASLAVLCGLGAASALSGPLGPVSLLSVAGLLYVSAGMIAALALPTTLPGAHADRQQG